jgi:hypothetical protein
MILDDLTNWIGLANTVCTLLGYLPKAIDKVRSININRGVEIKAKDDDDIKHLKEYLNFKTNKDEKKRCKSILKKHNLPKTVGVICKSEKDICFMPKKTIVDKSLNNLNLKSLDCATELIIGGGYFTFKNKINESGTVHQRVMNGTVIKYEGEIYLLRHPLGGYPNYLAKLDLFINGMTLEFDDGFKVGLYY